MSKEIIGVSQISNKKSDVEGGKMSRDYLARSEREKKEWQQQKIKKRFEKNRDQALLEKKLKALQATKNKKKKELIAETEKNLKRVTLENKILKLEDELQKLEERADHEVKIKDQDQGFDKKDELKKGITERMPEEIKKEKDEHVKAFRDGEPTEFDGYAYWDKTKKSLSELIKEKEEEIKKLKEELDPKPISEPIIPKPEDPNPISEEKEKQKMITWDGMDRKQITYDPVIPKPEEPKPEKIKVNIVNVDEIVRSAAWRIAKGKVDELLHKPEEGMPSDSRWKSIFNTMTAPFRHPVEFGKKVWVRAAEQGYLLKFYEETLNQITNNQNLLIQIEASARMGKPIEVVNGANKMDVNYELLNKVLEQYSANVVEQEERGNQITNPVVNAEFQNLIARHITENWTHEQFEQEQRALINNLKARGLILDEDFLGTSGRSTREVEQGMMYATNLFNVAEDYREHINQKIEELSKEKNLTPEQKKQIEEHALSTMQLDISLGAKISDIHNKRPEGTLSGLQSTTAKMQKVPILQRIASNPGAAAILGAGIGKFVGEGVARGMASAGLAGAGLVTGVWIPVAGAALAAGAFSAIRRNLELKNDRAGHQDWKLLGNESNDHRRKEMDKYQYDVRSSASLQGELNEIITAGNYANLNPDQQRSLASMLARFKVELAHDRNFRTGGQENKTVDLISVATREEGERYGTNLMSKTDLKVGLYEYLRNNNLIGGPENRPLNEEEFNNLLSEEMQRLENNISNCDRDFDRYRRRSAATMAAIAAPIGAVTALAGQEFASWISERLEGGAKYTAWDSLRDGFKSEMTPGKITESLVQYDNLNDFAKQLGYDTSNRVSYVGFADQGTAAERGIRALPETVQNLAHNLKLHADGTELMMQFKQNKSGDIIVDASKMIKNALKGSFKDSGLDLQQALAEGRVALLLSEGNMIDGSQHNPIKLLLGTDGKLTIPEELKNIFFGFDESGKLLNGAGNHPGLHSLVFDTGLVREDGANQVIQIASTLGERPELLAVVTETGEATMPDAVKWTVATSMAPRWQLEGEKRKKEQKEEKKKNEEEVSAVAAKDGEINEEEANVVVAEDRKIKEVRERIKNSEPLSEAQEINIKEKNIINNDNENVQNVGLSQDGFMSKIKNIFGGNRGVKSVEKAESPASSIVEETATTEVNRDEMEVKISRANGGIAWNKYKKYFAEKKSLDKIIGVSSSAKAILGDLRRVMSGESTNAEKAFWEERFVEFKKSNPQIKFNEFLFCYYRGLENIEKINNQKESADKNIKV